MKIKIFIFIFIFFKVRMQWCLLLNAKLRNPNLNSKNQFWHTKMVINA